MVWPTVTFVTVDFSRVPIATSRDILVYVSKLETFSSEIYVDPQVWWRNDEICDNLKDSYPQVFPRRRKLPKSFFTVTSDKFHS